MSLCVAMLIAAEFMPVSLLTPIARSLDATEGRHGSRWQAVMSISAKIGCAPQTLNEWVKEAEVDSGKRAGIPTDMAESASRSRSDQMIRGII